MKILVVMRTDEHHRDILQKIAPEHNFTFIYKGDLTPQDMEQAAVIIGNPPVPLLSYAARLRWLQLESSGASEYAKPGVLPTEVLLTCATGSFGPIIAEYLIAYTLTLFLKLPLYRKNQEQQIWHNEGSVRSIAGSTALSVGFGNIGREFSQRFHALGGHVLAVKRTEAAAPEYVDAVFTMDKLPQLLPRADVITVCLPETEQTRGLFNASMLKKAKPGALLLNVGRGSAVDSVALSNALYDGSLGGAALDVTDPEPLPSGHPLWTAPNCILTPHISGGYQLAETYERMFRICEQNLRRFLAGESLENPVDRHTGYAAASK